MSDTDYDTLSCVAYSIFSIQVLKERLLKRNNFDDTDDSIAKRVDSFSRDTLPVVEAFKAQVKKVNAERPKDEIFADVQKIMEAL